MCWKKYLTLILFYTKCSFKGLHYPAVSIRKEMMIKDRLLDFQAALIFGNKKERRRNAALVRNTK